MIGLPITIQGEIFEHDGVTSYTGDLRTLFEIRNSRDAYEYFLTAFQEKTCTRRKSYPKNATVTHPKHLRSSPMAACERPGTYKRHDFVTGKSEVGAAPRRTGRTLRTAL